MWPTVFPGKTSRKFKRPSCPLFRPHNPIVVQHCSSGVAPNSLRSRRSWLLIDIWRSRGSVKTAVFHGLVHRIWIWKRAARKIWGHSKIADTYAVFLGPSFLSADDMACDSVVRWKCVCTISSFYWSRWVVVCVQEDHISNLGGQFTSYFRAVRIITSLQKDTMNYLRGRS